jgi:hypothetical protein
MPAKFMNWLAILLCCGGVATREVAGADKSEEEQLILLLQALRNREQASNELWVRFRIRTHESAAFLTMLKGARQESDRHENLQCEYACKGAKTRSYSNNDNPADGDWMRGEYFNIYNGEISIRPSNEQKVYFLSRNPNPDRACELPSSIIGEDLLREDLEFWVAGKGKIHRIRVAEEVAEDGEPMLRLTSDWQRDIRLICWVIPSQGWTLRRFEEYIAGKPVRKHEVQEFMTSGGIYYPKRGSRSVYGEDDGKVHIKNCL